jgi:hypothetical protein
LVNGIPKGALESSREIRSARAVEAVPPMTCTSADPRPPDPGRH